MKFASIVALAAALFLYTDCKKKSIEYIVTGNVLDNSFGNAAAGTTVGLYEYVPGATGEPKLVTSVVTGADGTYSFTIKREKIEKYQLIFTKANYFTETAEFSLEDLSEKAPKFFVTPMSAKSWVKLRFVNPDNSGSVKIVKTGGKSGCDECCTFTEFTLYDDVTDSTIYCINDGNTAYSYHWFRLQTALNGESSVVTVPFDTTELVLNY